ncbi:MAG: TerB N-terminal domain-containing protein [bacterium]|nr:TerB N-terminal domain-containing protein [bacterium]
MGIFDFLKNKSPTQKTDIFQFSKEGQNLPALIVGGLKESNFIPEPTRSLVFVTDENPSQAEIASSLSIVVTVGINSVTSEREQHTNLNAEPSMIWTKLSVRKNSNLEENALYYPAYTTLTPEQRYQYLIWLRDVTQPTNLSYVFLYYYGLERHMLLGDFDVAAGEVLRLLKFHDKGTFRSYAETALLVSVIYRKRFDFLKDKDFSFQTISDELLSVRKKLGLSLTAKELMQISSRVGFRNKRYINKKPDKFESILEAILVKHESENGLLLDSIGDNELEYYKANCFANLSIPDEVCGVKVPDFLRNEKFRMIICSLLQQAYNMLKE